MNDTIFGKIIRGEVPATKVYEDDRCLAFFTIAPVEKGHLLLIPKEPYRWLQDIPDNLLSYLTLVQKKLMRALITGLSCDFVQIVVVGEEVPHAHIHLIPRMHGADVGDVHPSRSYENDSEKESLAAKIKTALL